ncbi:hypothetical protein ACFSYG_11910 [Leeuwenhoekiella polynyae]|uniref:Uncharacterized protein n=1 Tax=Leeuwenhoekiella polynyae TaxID=1550906 RepID=A0A4Q0PHH3_9FLAO|nr:hypothetical protein [Leeuwenhoekiella polynyae]RXG25699.1 hypothetical protein DSM02_866 [Leeuwenhoekiella polynyae]
MKNLNELIKWIEAADNRYFDVGDYGENEEFVKSISKNKAIQEAGSVSNYFANLAKSGHSHIWVKWVTKTASGWNNRKGPLFAKIGSKSNNNTPMENGSPVTPQNSPNGATPQAASFPGLGIPGLGFSDVMNLSSEARIGQMYKAQLDQLQLKYDALLDKYEDLKEDKKDEAAAQARQEQLITLANTFGPALMKFMPGANAAQPLNAPAENYSQTKTALLGYLKNPVVNDDLCQVVYAVATTINAGNQEFLNQLTELINKHNG